MSYFLLIGLAFTLAISGLICFLGDVLYDIFVTEEDILC